MLNWIKNKLTKPAGLPAKAAAKKIAVPTSDRDYKSRGDEHLEHEQWEAAAICYRRAIEMDAQDASSVLNLGYVLKEQKQYDEARSMLQHAIRLDSGMPDAYYFLGGVAQALGDAAQAIEQYAKLLEISPDFELVYGDLCQMLHQTGQVERAKQILQQGITRFPRQASFHFYMGKIHEQQGNTTLATESYKKALALQPENPQMHNSLGNSFRAQGQPERAIESYRQAIQLSPDYAEALGNLGSVLSAQGDGDQAISYYQAALQMQPGYAELHANLGLILQKLGRLAEAIASYDKALEYKPDFAEVHFAMGNVFKEQNKLDAALTSYEAALRYKSDYADLFCNQGLVYQEQGRSQEAIECYRKAISQKQVSAEIHYNLGFSLQAAAKSEPVCHATTMLTLAVDSYRQALALKPKFAMAYLNMGNALQYLNRHHEAVDSFQKAVQIDPNYVEARLNLGNAFHGQGRMEQAIDCFKQALLIRPGYAEAYTNLGGVYKDQGRYDEAVESYLSAISFKSDLAEAHSNLLFVLGYCSKGTPGEYLKLACKWEAGCVPASDRQAASERLFERQPRAGRRLRVGYVSGDFRQHAVSFFVEQLFTHHDRDRIELFAYATNVKQDAVTARLQLLVDHWIPVIGDNDCAVRNKIERDEIDVLIDLSGHTDGGRPGVFARRAAPVQAHYLGYFGSTGLTEMDYWIGDDILIPKKNEDHFNEQIWRLPRVWICYEGKGNAPLPQWKPSQDGKIWLGSFNALAKLTPATLALWAKILHALPEGLLLLKTKELADAGNCQRILDDMTAHGISADRIELRDNRITPEWTAHMNYYNRLDIALDPIGGISGGTTTCDALWMAVPVIALEGDRMASRMTTSMLSAIGHPDWIAQTEVEYIEKVVELSRKLRYRIDLREVQRGEMKCSPLCDAKGLAIALENAFEGMYDRWYNNSSNMQATKALI